MTVFETLILAALIGVLLFLAAGMVRAVRQQAKGNLCLRLMQHLREAITAYELETHTYPPGSADDSAGSAIAALLATPTAATKLAGLPAVLKIGKDPVAGVLDPWGHPVHYLTTAASHEKDRRDVAANGDMPIFESAGRDGNFGRNDPAAAADNRRTNDL